MPVVSPSISCALLACLLGFGASVLQAQVTEADVPAPLTDFTVSPTEQFRIYGSDRSTRASFSAFLELQKGALLRLLNVEDEWEHPIVVRLSGKMTDIIDEPPVNRSLVHYGDNFALEIVVRLCSDFTRPGMREAALEMLMFERALHEAEKAPEKDPVPRWLKEGIPGAMQLRREGRQSGFFASMVRLGIVPPAADLLDSTGKEADSISRTIYRSSASGFVLMLLEQKDGPDKLAKLIRDLGSPYATSQRNLLARYFPTMRGKAERMEQQWALYCTKLASPQALEFLSPVATEERIVDALTVSFLEFVETPSDKDAKNKKGKSRLRIGKLFGRGKGKSKDADEELTEEVSAEDVVDDLDPPISKEVTEATRRFDGSVADFERFLRRKDRGEILAPVRQRLLELSFRSFPSYRSMIQDYLGLVRKLSDGDTRGVKDQLEALQAERETLAAELKEVHDYLNWFEVTQLQTKSGAFREYLQRAREVESEARPKRDVLSRYLDDVEKLLK